MITFSNAEMRYIYAGVSTLCRHMIFSKTDEDGVEIDKLLNKIRKVIIDDIPIGELREE